MPNKKMTNQASPAAKAARRAAARERKKGIKARKGK